MSERKKHFLVVWKSVVWKSGSTKENLRSRAAKMRCCKTGCKKVCMYEREKRPPAEATLWKSDVWKSYCMKAYLWFRAAHMGFCKTVCKKAKQKVDQCKLSLLKKGSNSIVKMAEPKRKRRVLTLCQRLQIIKAVEDYPNKTRTQIAIDFGVPLPTLCNIVKDKQKYLARLSWALTKVSSNGSPHAGELQVFYI